MSFLEKHPLFQYELDSGSEQQVRNALDQFFDQYQSEPSDGEDIVYKEPDLIKMEKENYCLYQKYKAAEKALELGAMNTIEK